MVAFTKSFFPLLLATLFANHVEAAPWPSYAKHSTHRRRTIGKRAVTIDTFHPKNTFKTYGADGPSISAGNSLVASSLKDSALSFFGTLGVNTDNVVYKSGFTDGSARYAYIKQTINGIPLANGVGNVAFNGDKVVSFGSSFVDTNSSTIAPAEPTITWKSVLPQIEDSLGGKFNGQNATLEYLIQPDGSVALTHVVQIQNEQTSEWFEAFVDAHSGKLISVTDFVSDASYTVLPTTKQTFEEGIETLVDPEDLSSSPSGWHSIGNENSTTTSGNNVASFKGRQATQESSGGLNFNAEYKDTLDPTNPVNLDAARTNAFFVMNVMHDFSYRYGFTETAFNFQLSNFGKGGEEQDRVLVSVQDASGTNNANFATPPDGQSGICRMFIWDLTTPNRDGTMENDIMIHEMTHGITNRLTGGGTGRCLQTLEASGLGEGWGDAMASWMNQNSAETRDYVIGNYVTNDPKGLRQFPYSINKATNPLTYGSLQQLNEVHNIGEVWANMLHNVYAVLVDQRGFSAEKLTNPDGPEGNIVFMRLFMRSLSIQPCNPSFVEARDAWIQADDDLYNGANKCNLFQAFASRGLGLNADSTFVDDDTVPAGC